MGGGGGTQFKQVGKVGTVGGRGQRLRRRERGWGWGRTPDTKPSIDQNHPTRVPVKGHNA